MANISLKDIQFPGLNNTYTVPEVDNTLTQSGEAADAKKTGDEITSLKQDFNKIAEISPNLYNKNANTLGKNIADDKTITDSSTRDLSDYIYIGNNQDFTAKTATSTDNTGIKKLAWCDASKNIVSLWNNTQDVTQKTFNSGDTPYIRFTVMKSSEDFMVNLGSTLATFEAYGEAHIKNDAQSEEVLKMQEVYPIIEEWTNKNVSFVSGWINTSGSTVDVSSITINDAWRHSIITVKQNEIIKLKGAGGSSPRLWCFTDESYNVLSSANADTVISSLTEKTAPADGYLICNFSLANDFDVEQKVAYSTQDIKKALSSNELVYNGSYTFGEQANLAFNAPTIPQLTIPSEGERLDYFYGLFDALAEEYSDYITKVDCDAEANNNGISTPAYMSNYPIYMYEFKPPFAPNNTSISVTATNCDVLKTMIVGGTHPEYLAIYDLYQMMRLICESWQSDSNLDALRWETEIYVFPCQGAWCVEKNSRYNYNNVDLNRNMATQDFTVSSADHTGSSGNSEYESKVLAYYINKIKPQVFVDHHNTNVSDTKNLCYATCPIQFGIDVAGSFISAMTRKVKKLYSDTFPMNNIVFGWCRASSSTGLRSVYACEHGALGYTFETNDTLCYRGGEYNPEGYEYNTSLVCTLATDNVTNFVTRVLKMFSRKTNIYE